MYSCDGRIVSIEALAYGFRLGKAADIAECCEKHNA